MSTLEQSPVVGGTPPINLRREALAQIRRRIVSGEIPGGSTFSEANLSEELRISRAPVREALVVLNQLGWVTSQRGRAMSSPR